MVAHMENQGVVLFNGGAGDAKTKSETLFRHVGDGGWGKENIRGNKPG